MNPYQRSEFANENAIETAASLAVEASTIGPDPHRYLRESRSANTRRAYQGDARMFARWCAEHRQSPLPALPETVAAYVAQLADRGRKVATIERAVAAISQQHEGAGYPSPRDEHLVRTTLKGIRRSLGIAPRRKAPVLVADLRRMVLQLPDTLAGYRNRALLVLGFAGALRRSELVNLNVADIAFVGGGLEVTLRRSKTDQEGLGSKLGIPFGSLPATCPVRTVRTWLNAAAISSGPLFRSINRHGQISEKGLSPRTVATVTKASAAVVGLDPEKYGGHSLRAGLITSAVRAGVSEVVIMRQSRHKSVAVFRTYVRDADLFVQNAAAGIGL